MHSAPVAGDVDEVDVTSIPVRMTNDASTPGGESSALPGTREADDDEPIEVLLAAIAGGAATCSDASGQPRVPSAASRFHARPVPVGAQAPTEPATVRGIVLASARLVIGVAALYCLAVLLGGGA